MGIERGLSRKEGVSVESIEDRIKRLTVEIAGRSEFQNKKGIGIDQFKLIYPGISDRTIDRALEANLISKEMSRKGTRTIISIPSVVTLLCFDSFDRMRPQDRKKITRLARSAYSEYKEAQEKAKK